MSSPTVRIMAEIDSRPHREDGFGGSARVPGVRERFLHEHRECDAFRPAKPAFDSDRRVHRRRSVLRSRLAAAAGDRRDQDEDSADL